MAIKTEFKGGFLVPLPADHPSRDIREGRVKQYRHNLGDGYEVGYKLHVTLSEATYERDRARIASLLYNAGYDFKMLALKDISGDEDRAFTIYPKKEGDLLNIVASLLKAIQHHKIQPGAGTKTGLVVPGTNGVVTYYTERVNKKVLDDMLAAGAFSERAMYEINRYATPDAAFKRTLKRGGYMTSQGWESVLRIDTMKFLFGKGPLDFLWGEDINTELPPPPEPKKGGLRKTKPGPPHNKNNHFNGNATVLDKNNKPTKQIRRLNPKVRPGSIKDPVCSYCRSKMLEKHDSPENYLRDGRPPAFLFVVQDQSWKEYSPSKLPGIKERVEAIMKIIPPFTNYLTGSSIRPITAGPIVRSEYITSVRPNQTMLDWKKIQRDYPQLANYPSANDVMVVKIGSIPPNAYATTSSLNFNNNFTPKEWGVIYAHELGHYFGNARLGLYEKYHSWDPGGDKHCPYNCLFHHYMPCGNIAVGNEEAIYDNFVRPRPRRTN